MIHRNAIADDGPLELLVCSTLGCADDMYALLTTDDGGLDRLCRRHYAAARSGISALVKLDAALGQAAEELLSFESLSPLEQYQREGR